MFINDLNAMLKGNHTLIHEISREEAYSMQMEVARNYGDTLLNPQLIQRFHLQCRTLPASLSPHIANRPIELNGPAKSSRTNCSTAFFGLQRSHSGFGLPVNCVTFRHSPELYTS